MPIQFGAGYEIGGRYSPIQLMGEKRMTRKDYVLIAEVIATSWHGNGELKFHLANNMADALEGTNPLFNRARFLDACGVK